MTGRRRIKTSIANLAVAITAELNKEKGRRAKISNTKKGRKKPTKAFAAAFAMADIIKRRNPKISIVVLHSKLARDLPEGTDLPSEKTLRRYINGR